MTSDPVAGTAPAPTRRRWLRWVAALLGVLVALTLFAWLALPPLLKPQIEQRASAELGRPVRIGELSFEPWALRLGVSDLSIGPAAGAAETEPLLQVRRIVMDLSARSLLRLAPVIESLDIEGPKLRLARLGEGRYDIDDLIRRFADRPQPAQPARPQHFALFNLRVNDGALRFDDQPVARVHDLHDFRFELPFLSNLPDRLEVKVEPRLGFVLDDAPFEIKGRSTPFAQGRESQFDIRFDRLELGPLWAYLPEALPVRPEGGVLDSDLVLGFEQHDDQPPQLRLAGTIALHDLGVRERGGAPLLGWQSLRVHMADVQPLQRHVGLEKVQIAGLQLQLAREFDMMVMVHTPHRDKKAGTIRSMEVALEMGLPPHRVVIDHNNEETVRDVLDRGFWAAFTLYPQTKMGHERMVEIVRQYGSERIFVDSSADWGVSDPLAVPKTAQLMLTRGIVPAHVEATCYRNALLAYGQSGQFSESDWLEPQAIDQRELFEGNSVLRGQAPRIDEPVAAAEGATVRA